MFPAWWQQGSRVVVSVCTLCLAGCAVLHRPDSRRLPRYRPDVEGRRVARWIPTASSPGVERPAAWSRPLRKGDRLTLLLQLEGGKPPEQRSDMVDDTGCINLWRIGPVKIEGRTTSEAARLIEKAYRDGQIYTHPSVTIVLQEDQYYVQGEVRRPGSYSLRGDVTLRQAIASAGGFSEFADLTDVKIKRVGPEGQTVLRFDVKKIDKGKEIDPLIQPNDLIEVGRTWVGLGGL